MRAFGQEGWPRQAGVQGGVVLGGGGGVGGMMIMVGILAV